MRNKKLLIAATVVGLLGTSAAVGASGVVGKVTGIFHKDIIVTVNGNETSLHPVYIDGKAYLPAREAAAELGYRVNWNAKGKEIQINSQEEAADYIRMIGVIVDVKPGDEEGQYRIELLGHGDQNWMILYADKDTELLDELGEKPFDAKDLKPGTRIMAEFGPIIQMSYPGQSHAHRILVSGESLVSEDAIQSVERTDDGWKVAIGEDGKSEPSLVLNAGPEASVMTPEGLPVPFANLKEGDKVRAYYGPAVTKSIPPQSQLHYLVVMTEQAQLAPATVEEYRELGWENMPEDQKPHLLTKKEDALVAEIDSANLAPLASTDEQKKKLAEIQAAAGKVIEVKYSTDQDALLGPIVMIFDPESKAFLGFLPRM
ncbi:stalk domain-containing protein [Paenibacillaceae bacterium WGS1546]|uniref:stalk domain-containing protein n=1 Tax=Cohnella sp. WGS1546 TaxID=3366810 RepID=UPI00372D1400